MTDINDVFGKPVEVIKQVEEKPPAISPFDFINAISFGKDNLIVDEWSEKQYNSYVINKGLSFGSDTVIQANEMNSRPHLDKKLQFDFLINIIRPRKRFNKWIKAQRIEAIDIVKDYYGYSTEKARQALSILSDSQIDHLKQKLKKGGSDVK
jgi:hypothetical protein